MYRHILITIGFVWSFFAAYAQSYLDGFVITHTKDTLHGQLLFKEEEMNPEKISFRAGPNSSPESFTPEDVEGFGYKGGDIFHSYTVAVSQNYVDLKNAPNKSTPPVIATIFLRVMHMGPSLRLYSYQDRIKTRYYVKSSDSDAPLELGYAVIRDEGLYTEDFQFRGMLKLLAEDSKNSNALLLRKIDRLRYQGPAILEIVQEIDGFRSVKRAPQVSHSTGFRIGAGLNVINYHYYSKQDAALSANGTTSSTPGFWMSVGYDVARNRLSGKLFFRSNLTLSTAETGWETYEENRLTQTRSTISHTFTQRTIGLGLGIFYGLYTSKNFRLHLGTGFRGNYSFNDTDFKSAKTSTVGTVTEFIPDYEPREIWSAIPVELGALFSRRFEFRASYTHNRALNRTDFPYRYGIKILEVGGIYHLQRR